MDQMMKTDTQANNGHQSEEGERATIKGGPLTDYEQKILELWNIGKSAAEIAGQLGVTRNTIMGKIWRLRHRGVMIEVHKRPNTRGANAKPRERKPRAAPLFDLLFKKSKPLPQKVETDARPLNITFWQLKNSSCRYVVNDGRPENYIFCGAPKERGAYCEAHALICYNPPRLPAPTQRNPNGMQRYYR